MRSEAEIETPRDIDSLRLSLRLCFDARRSDRLAALVGETAKIDLNSLLPVFRAGRAFLVAGRLVDLLGSRSADHTFLGRPRGVSPSATLSLSLHLGLGLSVAELAKLTKRQPDRIGRDLMLAREASAGTFAPPCAEFASSIGRYRDSRRDRDEALFLMSHLSTCTRCRRAFEGAREFDEFLLNRLVDLRTELLPVAGETGRLVSLFARPAAFWGAITALLVFSLLGGIVAAGHFRQPARPPVALFGSSANPNANLGWLLESTDTGEVDALNVSTGAWRTLVPGTENGVAKSLISPDRKEVAQVTTSQPLGRPDQLRIFRLDGSRVNEWPLADPARLWLPLAWYDKSSILLCQIPAEAFGASSEIRAAQADQQGTLILFDVRTGNQRTIFNHGARDVVPSPDGRYVAVARYSTTSSRTIEIRAFDGNELGPVRSTMDDYGLPFFWMPDSKRVLFTQIQPVEATPVPRDLGDRGLSGQPGFSYAIATQDVDGRNETILPIPRGETGHVVGVSPDGDHMIYLLQSNTSAGTDWAFWRRGVGGGEPLRLASELPGVGGETIAWSPTGAAFLTRADPFYLSISAVVPLTAGPTSFITTMISADGRSVRALMDQLRAPTLFGFVDGKSPAAESVASAKTDGAFSTAQVVPGLVGSLSLVDQSGVNPGGNQLLAYDRVRNLYVGLSTSGEPVAHVAGAGGDPAWLPDGSGLISVLEDTSRQSTGSRIALYDSGSGLVDGLLKFDPANLGNAANMRYRMPELAPDGASCSFFVVGDRRISLWLSGRARSSQAVATWAVPSDARIDAPLVAQWVDKDTLIVAAVDDWAGGYPRRVDLQRVRLQEDGTVQIDPLVSWTVHGNERGVSITAMLVSSDSSKLAVRVRHFIGSNATDDVDSIDVMRTDDLSSSLEIVRGPSANGMSWSPDGSELAATVGTRIAVASWTGDNLSYLPAGSAPLAFPVWVRSNEIWFDAGSNGVPSVLRVIR